MKKQKGFSLMMIVVIVGSVSITLVLSLATLAGRDIATSRTVVESLQARGLAHACIEAAMQEIRTTESFTGTHSLNIASGTCNYTVAILSGESRSIEAIGVLQDSTQRIYVEVSQINPTIIIQTWEEN